VLPDQQTRPKKGLLSFFFRVFLVLLGVLEE